MNSSPNSNQYQGLLNQNIGGDMNCSDINCDEINAVLGNITTLNTVTGNITNISSTNITTTNINSDTGTFSSILTATNSPLSTISRSNTIYVLSDNGNQEFYLVGTSVSGGAGYYSLHKDNSDNISFNSNSHRLTAGFLRCTATDISTMTGGLTVSGVVTATNNASSVISNSNAVYTVGITTGIYYLPLISNTGGTGYRTLYNISNINYNAGTDTFHCGIVNTNTAFITDGSYISGTIGTSTPSIYIGGSTGNKQGMLRFSSGTTGFNTYVGSDSSGNFYIEPTDTKTLNICTKSVTSSSNLNIGASAIPTSITIYGNTNQTGIITSSTGNFLLGDWNSDTPSLSLGSPNNSNEGVLELISNSTQSFLLEATNSGGFEIYLKTSGTAVALFQLNSTYYNIYTNINISSGFKYKINNIDLNTDDIQEKLVSPSNLYFTNARARSSITPTNTTEINHTYSTSTGVLTSNINNTSVTNAMLSGSIANSKLINSSITLGSTSMSLGTTTTTVAGMTSLTSTGLTANGGTSNITTFTSAVPSLTVGLASTNSGVIKIFDSSTATFSLIQHSNSTLYIDTSANGGFIQIGSSNQLQNVVIGNSTKGVSLYGTILLGSSVIFSSLSMSSIKYTSGGIDIPYNNVKMARLTGSGTTNLITPNWQRVQNTAGSSILEVQIYTPSATGTFKVEGQIATLYNSTNDRTNFNIGAFKNSASSATQSNLTNMLNGDLFVSRNIGTVGAVFTIPFITFFSYTGCTAGDFFTISCYYQSGTSFANGSTVGRTASDIPSTLVVTQIS